MAPFGSLTAFQYTYLNRYDAFTNLGTSMRQRAFTAIVLLALSHFAFADVPSALAQGGSTGGTIGKQDKSVSGGESASPSRPKEKLQENVVDACKHVPGTWSWVLGTTTFKSDRTSTHSWGNSGTWTCVGGVVAINWADGGINKMTVLAGGTTASVISVTPGTNFTIRKF